MHLYSQREEKPCDGDEYCCAETTWNKMGKFGFESGCSRTVRAERFVVNAEPKSVQHTSQPVVSSNVTGLGDKGVAVLPKILRFLKVPTEPDFRAFGHKVSSEVSTSETLRVQFER